MCFVLSLFDFCFFGVVVFLLFFVLGVVVFSWVFCLFFGGCFSTVCGLLLLLFVCLFIYLFNVQTCMMYTDENVCHFFSLFFSLH